MLVWLVAQVLLSKSLTKWMTQPFQVLYMYVILILRMILSSCLHYISHHWCRLFLQCVTVTRAVIYVCLICTSQSKYSYRENCFKYLRSPFSCSLFVLRPKQKMIWKFSFKVKEMHMICNFVHLILNLLNVLPNFPFR